MVELTVLHPPTGAHALNVTGRDRDDIAHIVLVGQFASQNVADDLHVTVTMGSKTRAWFNAIFIDHPQISPPHVGWIVVTGKRKAVK